MERKTRDFQTVAVTGATGLIGRRLMPVLVNAAIRARALVRSSHPKNNFVEIRGDLGTRAGIDSLVTGADAVVHLAGIAHSQLRSSMEVAQARQINVEGTRVLVKAAEEAGVRHFIFMSSAHVYRGQNGLDLSEDSPTEGDTAYGQMKLEAEETVRAARTPVMRVTILRPCLTYGPGVRFNLQSLMRAVRKGDYVHVREVDSVRSMASVDTVAAAILHLLETPSAHDTFNIADRSPVHLAEWTNHLAELMQASPPRSVPYSIMSAAADVGSLLRMVGVPAPITRSSLQKLVTSFSLNTDRLASTGFSWPETRETVLREMISAEFANQQS